MGEGPIKVISTNRKARSGRDRTGRAHTDRQLPMDEGRELAAGHARPVRPARRHP